MKKPHRNTEDHTGKVYNYFTVMHYVGRQTSPSGQSKTVWRVRCICGKEIDRSIHNIKRGSHKSCGCMKAILIAKSQLLPNGESILRQAYTGHILAAKKRNYRSSLTYEQYVEMIKKPCHYCGEFSTRKSQKSPGRNRRKKRKAACSTKKSDCLFPLEIVANSIDRLNNEPFYDQTNSVPCCFICQKLKGTLSYKSFIGHVLQINNFQNATNAR